MEAANPYSAPTAGLESGMKKCESCGAGIRQLAEICPACGVRQRKLVSKPALLLLTFFLGAFGAHKFYLGKWVQGIFYLLFCWTGIPGLIALIEFIVYACTSTERLNEKYSASGSIAVILIIGIVFGLFVIGILAAVAIPAYQDFTLRSKVSNTIQGMLAYKAAVGEHFDARRQLPASGAEVETGALKAPHTQSVRVARGGVIIATLTAEIDSRFAGKAIVLAPRVEGAALNWTCGVQESFMVRLMPASCRTVMPLP